MARKTASRPTDRMAIARISVVELMAVARGIVRNGNLSRHFVPLSLIEAAKR